MNQTDVFNPHVDVCNILCDRCSSPFKGDLVIGEETPSTVDPSVILAVLSGGLCPSSSFFFVGLQSFAFPLTTHGPIGD